MSIPAALASSKPLKQTLATLRSDEQKFGEFVLELFDDLGTLHEKLVQAESRLREEQRQLAEERCQFAAEHRLIIPDEKTSEVVQAKVTELELDRQTLLEELESVRARAIEMAETIAQQKCQIEEEHSQWSTELRQLRRMLDKQTGGKAQPAPARSRSN
ncbi:MAG TPA: hypothetical protein VGJ15_04640 [Pirellulales bacterium]|jgi:hypothetical protein